MKNQLVSIHTFSKICSEVSYKAYANKVLRLRRHCRLVVLSLLSCVSMNLGISQAFAQQQAVAGNYDAQQILQQIRWQSESKVREILGAPKAVRGPIGTHASYQLWEYEDYSVAIANNRAFHLFDKNSLHRMALQEDRP